MPEVLIVDDEKVVRDVLSDMLASMGYEVVTAGSGEEGLSLFLNNSFKLVLTDLDMPSMDGLTLACRIKENAPNTSVIIITGSEEEAVVEKLKKDGCVDSVVFKPFSYEELQNTIHGKR